VAGKNLNMPGVVRSIVKRRRLYKSNRKQYGPSKDDGGKAGPTDLTDL